MASERLRLPENQPGPFFVDQSCIDCDTCRQLAPEVFSRSDRRGCSVVAHQPASDEQRRLTRLAVIACPVGAIGAADKRGLAEAARAFPVPLDAEVSTCGYASPDSYGAASYFITRTEGNVLVDSPRAAGPLLRRLQALGGVALMFLSHRDDVADHASFARVFGCRRVLHAADVTADTRDVELSWQGRETVALAPDLLLVPVPGHTSGSAALLYRERYLFTGDHLWGTDDGAGLEASRSVCWHSWVEQLASLERLLGFRFEWVLPGHGRQFRARSAAAMHDALTELLERLGRRPRVAQSG
jgi:glyoxylase-like metal-dependent hydrolase (beta-lactamase superfamily II)/ferredoxin